MCAVSFLHLRSHPYVIIFTAALGALDLVEYWISTGQNNRCCSCWVSCKLHCTVENTHPESNIAHVESLQ
jgi:hypothetical protein